MFLSLKLALNGERISSVTPPPGEFLYIRSSDPGSGFLYLRPGTTFKYIRLQ